MRSFPLPLLVLSVTTIGFAAVPDTKSPPGVGWHKTEDVLIYSEPEFYSAFPSVVCRPDGELIVAFRRAPERRKLGEPGSSHTDPNSYLVLVRSRDQGRSWSKQPELIYAHPFGGSQDPCMLQLNDGSILCSSYGWALLAPEAVGRLERVSRHGNFVFLGGYLARSTDGARTWTAPILPPTVPGESTLDAFGKAIPAYNRGAMCQGKDGLVYWVVAASTSNALHHTGIHLLTSTNAGQTWAYSCPVANDPKVAFNETSIYQTPKGNLIAFIRTENFNDHTAMACSTNGGRSFGQWKDAGFQGHPHYALRLPDDRVLLVYGYRHQPYGIRARILNAECTNPAEGPELILRSDGGNGDLGYPWAALLPDKRVLVVYYFNQADGTRHIAGTFLSQD